MVEMLIVLSIMGILAGLGISGTTGIRRWMGTIQTEALFMELESACRMYRLETGEWPSGGRSGEWDLEGNASGLRMELASFLENHGPNDRLEDGFGNRTLYLIFDTDGDHWIEPSDFEALSEADRPERLWKRVVAYSLGKDGELVAQSW